MTELRTPLKVALEDEPSELRVFINPEIVSLEGKAVWEEGCLSFPGVHEEIERAAKVTVRALDERGQKVELTTDGLLGVAVQHENDHLDGTIFVDRVKDPRTLCTWAEFDRFHKAAFVERIVPFVKRMRG